MAQVYDDPEEVHIRDGMICQPQPKDGHPGEVDTELPPLPMMDAKCFVCGGRPTAFWGLETCVCPECAVEKLPLLIADAVAGNDYARNEPMRRFEDALPKIIASYWRGASHALSRQVARERRKAGKELRQAMGLERQEQDDQEGPTGHNGASSS